METIDIIKEMRGTRPDCDDCLSNHTCEYLIRFADRLDAAHKRDLQSMVEAGDTDMRTAMDEVTKLREENERLRAALKDAIPFSCQKCIFCNSRTASCSRCSGMCTQVWKWKVLLGEVHNV